jgi:hypothetical protein
MSHVVIQRVSDGTTRQYAVEDTDDLETFEYLWTDGNYGCACQLAQFFAHAAGEPDPEVQPCGVMAYRVLEAKLGERTISF